MYSVSSLFHAISLSGYHITLCLTSLIPIPPPSHAWRASLRSLDKKVSEPGVLQAITQGQTPLQVAAFVRRWCQIPGLQRQHILLSIRPSGCSVHSEAFHFLLLALSCLCCYQGNSTYGKTNKQKNKNHITSSPCFCC